MPMRSDDEKLNSTDSSSFLFPPRSGTWSDGPEYKSTTYSMSTSRYNKKTSDANDASSSMDTSNMLLKWLLVCSYMIIASMYF